MKGGEAMGQERREASGSERVNEVEKEKNNGCLTLTSVQTTSDTRQGM